MKSVSPEEQLARKIVFEVSGLDHEFCDFDGKVDFILLSGSDVLSALEVSRVSNKDKIEFEKFNLIDETIISASSLNQDWLITVDGIPRINRFKKECEELIQVLENIKISEIHESHFWQYEKQDNLKKVIANLRALRIKSALSGHFLLSENTFTEKHIIIMSSENYVFGGAAQFLDDIETWISQNSHNLRKLRDSNSIKTQLFLWIDSHTSHPIRAGFESNIVAGELIPHNILNLVSDLWIADEVTRTGIHYSKSEKSVFKF